MIFLHWSREPPRRLPVPVLALEGATSNWASVVAAHRGTCPQLVLEARVLRWLLLVGRPVRFSLKASCNERNGQYRCYAVDNRPWCGPGHPAAAYVYSEDRKGEHPQTHLRGFRGLLQVDGYAGFGGLVNRKTDDAPQLAFCWAHNLESFFMWSGGPAS
jgi:hypothetical protein